MVLNIFLSNTTTAATSAAINRLRLNNQAGSSHIFIVPDRYTLSVEKEIYEKLNLKGSFNIDVVSFSRLAQKSLNLKKRFLSKEATVMLMKKAIDQTKKDFVYFNNMTFSIGFAKEMFAVVASFRNSCISQKALTDTIALMPENKRAKYKDIALIYKKYESLLNSSYSDTISRLDAFIDAMKDNAHIKKSHIYVAGFNVYSQKQLDIIKEALAHCKSVNIAAAWDSGGGNKALFPTLQISALKEYALDKNIKVHEELVFERLEAPFDFLHREFFAYSSKKSISKDTHKVTLFSQKNPYEEIKAVAREIIYHIKNGKRFMDISLVCCNDDYKKCIADIFDRYGIPYFIDQRYSSKDSLTARFITAVMEMLIYNYRREDVTELVKHPYFGIENSTAEAFENYCLEYNISYNRFLKEFSLGDYSRFEGIRNRLMDIRHKASKLSNACQISDFILQLCADKDLDYQINHPSLEASKQSHEKIVELIEEIKELMGGESMSLDEYYSIFAAGLNNLEIALLPQYIDSVFVGNTRESKFSHNDILFIVGANQGFFPFKNQEQTIITYADILTLKKYGIELKPNPLESNAFEQFLALDLIVKADRLYVSCSHYSLQGQVMQYGEAIKELSYLLDKDISSEIEHKGFDEEQALIYRLATPDNAFYEYIIGGVPLKYRHTVRDFLIQNGFQEKLDKLKPTKEDFSNLKDYYFKNQDGAYITSVSQLESYFRCPYIHFLRYGLRIKEKPVPDLGFREAGIIIHNILETYFKSTLGRIREFDDKEIEKEAKKAVEKVFEEELVKRFSQDELGKAILKNIKKESLFAIMKLSENVKNSCFTPKYIELYFSEHNQKFKALTVQTDNGKFFVRGKIDRVDVYNDKAVIIDYKTGWEEGKLQDIYFGNKIQLYVYLCVFMQNGFVPAGVFYLPIRDGYRAQGERFVFKGQVDQSIDTIRELDRVFIDLAIKSGKKVKSQILGLTANPNKELDKIISDSKNKLSLEDFQSICSYVEKLIQNALQEISWGNINKAPVENVCEMCAYTNHCPAEEKKFRTQRAVQKDIFCLEEKDG